MDGQKSQPWKNLNIYINPREKKVDLVHNLPSSVTCSQPLQPNYFFYSS